MESKSEQEKDRDNDIATAHSRWQFARSAALNACAYNGPSDLYHSDHWSGISAATGTRITNLSRRQKVLLQLLEESDNTSESDDSDVESEDGLELPDQAGL